LEVHVGLTGSGLGTFIHRCFEVLGARPDLKGRIAQITGVAIEPEGLEKIAAAVGQFEAWLETYFNTKSVLREWPILALDEQGSVVSGMADLVVETTEGLWVIDHKSDHVDEPTQAFGGYRNQLESYAAAIVKEGNMVLGIAINWIRRGEVVLQRLESRR